jgi:hypothetical protein
MGRRIEHMKKQKKTKDRGTNFTTVMYAKYETVLQTSHILASKIFSATNDETSNNAATCHSFCLPITF